MDRMRGLWNAAHSERMQSPGDAEETHEDVPVFALSPPTIARLTARRVGLFLFSSCAVCALAPSRQYYVVQLCSCMSPMLSLPQLPIVRGGIFDGTRGMNCTRMNGSRMLDSAGEDLYLLEQRSRCPACRSACPHWHQTGTDPQAPSRDGRSVVADAAENAADGCLPAHAEDVVLDRLVRGTVVARIWPLSGIGAVASVLKDGNK